MLKMTAEKVAKLKGEGKDNFSAKNESQSFNAVTLSVVYGEVCSIFCILGFRTQRVKTETYY